MRILAFAFVLLPLAYAQSLRIATWNLRFDSRPDNITVKQSLAALPSPLNPPSPAFLSNLNGTEVPWSTRRLRVAEYLLSRNIDVLGVQEALIRQVHDLAELFGHEWNWVGVGRDDGKESGEFSAVFWRTDALRLLSHDTFWLSQTPLEPSKFPGAGSVRLCTATRFAIAHSGSTFSLLNTHLDDQSDDQRKLGASMLLLRAQFEAFSQRGSKSEPVFVIGDFNSPPNGTDSGAYEIMTGKIPPVAVNATWAKQFTLPGRHDFKMLDLRGEAPRQNVKENFATFTGFKSPTDTSSWQRIDFVYGGNNRQWSAQRYDVDAVLGDDGVLMSDHRPTIVDIKL